MASAPGSAARGSIVGFHECLVGDLLDRACAAGTEDPQQSRYNAWFNRPDRVSRHSSDAHRLLAKVSLRWPNLMRNEELRPALYHRLHYLVPVISHPTLRV
jgi:hypothetical protein